MSVAFRREGDDEHLEPKFEIPIPPGPNLVTTRGKALIDARVADLAAQVAAAGDEDAARRLQRDLRYWQTRQVTAQVMPGPSGEVVAFGTRVTFRLNGKSRVLAIVGDDEADPARDMIAFSAPLARALMDGAAGEFLPFGDREDAIEVLAVEPIG
ncbi:GreA/GreB family elongation factor [Novosphingobium album (ex Liu et al. 2023)]|uniref:GreA/GreB family elongation factor n=1 Tax=Novosphingobium album (ex Liu et al. 2023) TaxID=3031130 RepID=A0ABT5WRP6_9SPHN|nr:GreA/GreB family elongation factor [Novosphingobium album (ex Liu et al. 2023)]MDE8652719.1 GreA/GreB family elongation factor [Novosphingobium album (ex Liu et al. 2023)]